MAGCEAGVAGGNVSHAKETWGWELRCAVGSVMRLFSALKACFVCPHAALALATCKNSLSLPMDDSLVRLP